MNYDQGDLLAELERRPKVDIATAPLPRNLAAAAASAEIIAKIAEDREARLRLQVATANTPRCVMCARPARWLPSRQVHAAYCGGRHCDNRERICQRVDCAKTFIVNMDGAGTKYCSTECKIIGYHPATQRHVCVECQTPMTQHRDKLWPPVCEQCRRPLRFVENALRNHHVPWQLARTLLDNPGCRICGVDIVSETTSVPSLGFGQRAKIHVDHDHQCCPRTNSCGKCVRGFLCAACNHAVGLLRDQPDRARALADYLDQWTLDRN